MGHGRLQHPLGARGQGGRQFGGAFRGRAQHHARVRRGGGQESGRVRLAEQAAAVVPEDGDARGVDDAVRVERVAVGAVVVVELARPQQAGVQRGAPAQGLLLGLGAVQVAAAGIAGGGEVEHGDLAAEPPGGLQAALAGDFESGPHRDGNARGHGLRPVHPRALAGPFDRRADRHLAAVGRAVAPGRHDLLGLPGEIPQARAHGATPVDALTTRRAVSLVVLMRESWVMLVVRRNGVLLSADAGESPRKQPGRGHYRSGTSRNASLCGPARGSWVGRVCRPGPPDHGSAAWWNLRRIPTCPIRLVAVSGHVPPSVRPRSRRWSTASASRPVRPGSSASRWNGWSTSCARRGSPYHPTGSRRCTPRCGPCP